MKKQEQLVTRKVLNGRFCNTNEMYVVLGGGIAQSITATYGRHADSTDHSNLVLETEDETDTD